VTVYFLVVLREPLVTSGACAATVVGWDLVGIDPALAAS